MGKEVERRGGDERGQHPWGCLGEKRDSSTQGDPFVAGCLAGMEVDLKGFRGL